MNTVDFIKIYCYKANGALRYDLSAEKWWVDNGFIEFRDEILLKTAHLSNPTMAERIFNVLNNITCIKHCDCGNKIRWSDNVKRYLTYCSRRCASKYTVNIRQKTSMLKYGVDNPAKSTVIKEKIKVVNKNYEEIKDKTKKSFEKYSGGHPSRDPIIRNKTKETCLLRYNAATPLKSPIILKKITNTLNNKYGVNSPLKNNSILSKQRQTVLEKYGIDNYNRRHLTVEQIEYRKHLTKDSDFTKLGLSTSAMYKAIKGAGIVLSPSRSLEEIEIYNFIMNLLGRNIENNIKIDNTEFDIYDPITNIAIEYNGVYWHSELAGKDKYYHLRKTEIANKNGIRLIHIFSDEWKNRKIAVKTQLMNIFKVGIVENYSISYIDVSEAYDFIENTHIAGKIEADMAVSIHNNDLMAVALLKNTDNKCFIKRYAANKTIENGLYEVAKWFSLNNNCNVYYKSDLRWDKMILDNWELMEEHEPMLYNSNTLCYNVWDCGARIYKL